MSDHSDSQPLQQSPEEEYLHLLLLRDRMIRQLREANQDLSEQLRLKDQENQSLQQQLAQSRQEVLRLHQSDAATSPTDPLPHPSEATSQQRAQRQRKPRHINPDLIQRLRRDHKAAPIVCDAALQYWDKLLQANIIDEQLRPTYCCTHDLAALIVNRMQIKVDPAIPWAFLSRYWKITNLQSFLRRPSYKGQRLYPVVNQIFGLPDDATVQTKSQLNV